MIKLGARRPDRARRGQSLVEFALVLPVILLILLFTIDLGRVFLGWVQLNNAARIAANYAASGDPPLTAAQQTQYRAIVGRETTGINCDVPSPIPDPTYPGSTGTLVGGRAVVALTCSFHLITPLIGNLFTGGVVTVGASADFPIRAGILANVGPGATLPAVAPPDQDFTVTPSSGPAPLTVSFALGAQSGGAAQTWLWDFGDGTTDAVNATPPAHTYADTTPQTYTVKLTETNGAGQSVYTHTVTTTTAGSNPVANFYGTVPSPCVTVLAANAEQCGGSTGISIYYIWPMTVNFTDTSTNNAGATYSWDFGDGSTSTAASPSHTYSNPGVYSVTQTVRVGALVNSLTRSNYVNGGCVTPTFVGTSTTNADTTWTSAHFLSANLLYYKKSGNSYSYSAGAPNGNGNSYTIGLQNPQSGLFYTVSAGNQCTTVMKVAPTGANPAP